MRTLVVVNDRPDIAVLADADGVHLGQDDLRVKDARAIVGPRRLIGVSTHSIEQARAAVLDGANYLGVGPTFPSRTKSFDAFPGLDFVRQVAAEIRLPAFAIGGIEATNVGEVVAAGLRRVAVGSAVMGDAKPRAAVAALRERLD
jgi:thiamine-phosphate pyrophosphorylase